MAVTLARDIGNIKNMLREEINVLNMEMPEEERVIDVTKKIMRATRKLEKRNIRLVRKEKGLKDNLKVAKQLTSESIADIKKELRIERRIRLLEHQIKKIEAKMKELEEKNLGYTKKLLEITAKQQEKLDDIKESFGDRKKCVDLINKITHLQIEKRDLWSEKHSNEQRIIVEAEKLKNFQEHVRTLKRRELRVAKEAEAELKKEETAEERGEIEEAA
ncbi:hypothetical protein KY339_02240 [Candidatus Woesearchaeota archaeon]|nr:hypothetical protein [Candidatus Woesearchaeota archaeon]